MADIFIARQEIRNLNGKLVAYELLYRDTAEGIIDFPSNIKATAHVLLTALTYVDLNEVIGKDVKAFINVDKQLLHSNILDVLDHKRFVIEILEDTEIDSKTLEKIKKLKNMGFEIAIDDFDGSAEMIKRFKHIFEYTSIIKIDAPTMNIENIKKLMPTFKSKNIELLIEKVETQEEMREYRKFGFHYFQGYGIKKPETITVKDHKEVTQLVILKLITIIKEDGETKDIENYLKRRPDIVLNILRFMNNQNLTQKHISSILQAITLLGRDQLSKWLLIYLYSEMDGDGISKTLLDASIYRAEEMEALATGQDKKSAFIVGLFSMIGELFGQDASEIFKSIQLDSKISSAIIHKNGVQGNLLREVEKEEKEYLKDIMFNNFDLLNSIDIFKLLEKNKIEVN